MDTERSIAKSQDTRTTFKERWEKDLKGFRSLKSRIVATIVSGGWPRVYLKQGLTDFRQSFKDQANKERRPCPHCGAPGRPDDFSDLLTIGIGLMNLVLHSVNEEDFDRFEDKLLKVKIEDYLVEEGYEDEATRLVPKIVKELGDYWDKHDMQAWRGALSFLEQRGEI